jgi:uncharacterized protein (TIGR02145 family)
MILLNRPKFIQVIIIGIILFQSCEKEKKPGLPMDGDGNEYDTVVIGTQVWLDENLKTTKYRDGRPIQLITENTQWAQTTLAAYCWLNNYQGLKESYGALYNWNAAKLDFICPDGYHIPTIDEWNILINYLGGQEIAGGKLKETGTMFWLSPNTGATNESGFSARAGGVRYNDGGFMGPKDQGTWWTATPNTNDERYAWRVSVKYSDAQVYTSHFPKTTGYSVRCIKN